jgi:hypothetical protein
MEVVDPVAPGGPTRTISYYIARLEKKMAYMLRDSTKVELSLETLRRPLRP